MSDTVVSASTRPIADLAAEPRNPRTITEEAFAKLCESIQRDPQFMVLRPIVVDALGTVIGGNMRTRACKHLGMTEVPASWVVRAGDLTPEQIKRFVVIDNAPAGMAGDWDWDMLAADWEIPDLEMLGMDVDLITIPESNKPVDEDAMKDTKNECPSCGFKW